MQSSRQGNAKQHILYTCMCCSECTYVPADYQPYGGRTPSAMSSRVSAESSKYSAIKMHIWYLCCTWSTRTCTHTLSRINSPVLSSSACPTLKSLFSHWKQRPAMYSRLWRRGRQDPGQHAKLAAMHTYTYLYMYMLTQSTR